MSKTVARAQSTIEYALFVLVVVLAGLAMTVYAKRAMQGGFRSSSDELGEQYDPRHTNATITTTRNARMVTESDGWTQDGMDVTISESVTEYDVATMRGYEAIEPMGGLWE
jgi:hypothetical protein